MLKPFLKWVGGKTQILKELFKEFNFTKNNYIEYYEPFVGGGSVFLELLNTLETKSTDFVVPKIFISDFNKDLINVYKTIKKKPNALVQQLKIIKENYDKAKDIKYEARHKAVVSVDDDIENVITKGKSYVYYYYRKVFNSLKENKDVILKSALFIFLNKTGFRGLYRVSSNGEFNVPFGNYKTPSIFNEDELLNMSIIFRKYDVDFKCCKYQTVLEDLHAKTKPLQVGTKTSVLVYLDPPYYPVDKNSFLAYSADGFTIDDQKELRNFLIEKNKPFLFVQSNLDCEGIRELYNSKIFKIKSINCKRRINSKNPEATENEVIIKNF